MEILIVRNSIPLSEAKTIALEIYELLKPHCERIKIAGSIRREKAFVNDIEIVCIPKKRNKRIIVLHRSYSMQ